MPERNHLHKNVKVNRHRAMIEEARVGKNEEGAFFIIVDGGVIHKRFKSARDAQNIVDELRENGHRAKVYNATHYNTPNSRTQRRTMGDVTKRLVGKGSHNSDAAMGGGYSMGELAPAAKGHSGEAMSHASYGGFWQPPEVRRSAARAINRMDQTRRHKMEGYHPEWHKEDLEAAKQAPKRVGLGRHQRKPTARRG
jgi:hypothetical protein